MFRIKVAASLFLVFAAVGSVIYVNMAEAVEATARERVEQRLHIARKSLTRIRGLNDFAVVAKAAQVAAWPQLAQVLTRSPESFADEEGNLPDPDEFSYQVHRLMNAEVLAWKTRFEGLESGKVAATDALADYRKEKPDLFAVVDARGIGVAKASDLAWYGAEVADLRKDHPILGEAVEKGRTLKDIWLVKGAPMTVAAAPVRSGDRVVGAVVLGYRLTDAEARRDKGLVDADVAYFIGERLSQSSSLNATAEDALQKVVAEQKLYADHDPRTTVRFELRGQEHLAFAGPLPGYASAKNVGYVILANLDQAVADAREVLIVIPVAALLGFVLCLGLVLVFFQRFMQPFEEIDQGVLEIINGNMDYWFEIKGKELPGTMSQNLNIMVCQLSGRPLPEDDDATEGEHWAQERMFVEEMDGSNFHTQPVDMAQVAAGQTDGLPPAVVQLVTEDQASYQRRVFEEYTAGLRAAGQPTQGITLEKFVQQLETNAASLRAKYGCSQVRFLVEAGGGRVSLKPVPMN